MMRRLEIWMLGFGAGLVVAVVLGMISARAGNSHQTNPATDERGPNRMQMRPKVKSNSVHYAFASEAVAS
jgi:hypothetical protein